MIKNRLGYFILVVLTMFLMFFYHNYFFFMFFLIVCFLPIFSLWVLSYTAKNTTVDIKMPRHYYGENQDIEIKISINNACIFPLPSVKIRYRMCNGFYANDETHEMTLPVRVGNNDYTWSVSSCYSGNVSIEVDEYSLLDYLGLRRITVKPDIDSFVSVIPERSEVVVNLIDSIFYEGEEETADIFNRNEDVTAIRDYREYQPGDRLQRIHWRLSAKEDEWYVKEYERELDRTFTLLIELRRDSVQMGDLNDIITAFYSTAMYMIDQDMRFQVQWYDLEINSFLTEVVASEDDLLLVIQSIYRMKSYEDRMIAYEEYGKLSHKKYDMTIYFTTIMLPEWDSDMLIGKYKERVNILCLRNL